MFQNNRPVLNAGARRGSGGIAIAINNSIFESHTVVSIMKGVDGQISVKLKNNQNDFLIGILALYLPPDNYIYGKDPETFFNEAGVLWEDLFDCDLIIGGGDLNSRTKNMVEYLPDIDGSLIPPRNNPDQIKNSHGNSFITFLKENRSIILNGRVTPEFNNYTYVTQRGCSVPDYLFCPVDHLTFCREMKIILMSDIVNMLNIQPPRSLPDHSLLLGTFETSFYDKSSKLYFPQSFPPVIHPPKPQSSTLKPKKNLKKMTNGFLMTVEIRQEVLQTINKIENAQSSQQEINQLWSEIKSLFLKELDKLPSRPTTNNKKQNRLYRKCQKFWNDDLESLWKTTCQAEKAVLTFKVRTNADLRIKSELRNHFKNAQKIFDRTFRQAERNFQKKNNTRHLKMMLK